MNGQSVMSPPASAGLATNHSNGHGDLSSLPGYERIRIMRREGWAQTFTTGRTVKLRTLEPDMLLREADCPDILTPLLLKSLYGNSRDNDVRDFMEQPLPTKQDAFAFMELLDLICRKSICDDTKVEELTLAEKRMIFRFALGTSELLVSFVYEPSEALAAAQEGDNLPQIAE